MKSDSDLKQDVENELKWDPSINEAHIGVSASSGVVTLSGHVPSFAEKFAAEMAVKRVYSVKGIANELDVHVPGKAKRTDEDVAISCTKALDAAYSVPSNQIKVLVQHGWVTLEGEVEWNFQKDAAMKAVRSIAGICGVTNAVVLKKRTSPADVTSKIVAAFHRSADIDARRIQVEAHNGTVVLSGRVRSWAERDQAQEAAFSAPGVTIVENLITIEP